MRQPDIKTILGCPACPATRGIAHWFALDRNTYDGPESILGSGSTKQEAIDDLQEQLADQSLDS